MNKLPLIYWANKISLRKSAGQVNRLSSLLAQSTIDLNPHQLHAVLFAFNSPLSRGAILADEVGLGKTIEAGIVISQLYLEGRKRILIIAPASLRTQWREELELHFNLPSTILDTKYFDSQINSGAPVPMTTDGIYIASLPFVYKRLKLVQQQPWDLIVIDEAHRLRRVYRGRDASKMAYELRQSIHGKAKLLLTATPLQNELMELYGLVSFIDDKLLGSPYFFKTRYLEVLKENSQNNDSILKTVRDLVLGSENGDAFEHSQGVIVRTLRKQVRHYVSFPLRQSLTADFTPTDEEWNLYELVSSYLQRDRLASIEHTQRNLMILVYRKLLASSSFAIAPTLERLGGRLKAELERRKNKSPDNGGAQVQDELPDEYEELSELENVESSDKDNSIKNFTDGEIKKELQDLEHYHKLAVSIKENTKGKALVATLKSVFKEAEKRNWPQKAVVFTESRRTQEYLKNLLEHNSISVTVFNGSNNSKQAQKAYENWKREFPELAIHLSKNIAIRQALIYEFKQKTQIFLTTEAGGEGLNLQFANIIVNFDLPWNPQRVEQRIGRCHRYGQKYETLVVNMLNIRNHADKRLLELLQEKLNLFEGIFGSSDEILGAIGDGMDFEKRILGIYQKCKTPQQIDAEFDKLKKELDDIRKKELTDIRSKIIDHLDTPILQLFKKTKEEVNSALTDYDRSLMKLCELYLGEKMQPDGTAAKFLIDFQGEKKPYLFREENEDEYGKIPRIHKEHPVISHILNDVSALTTSPIPVVEIQYTSSDAKMRTLDSHKGKEGILFLFKLIVEGIETDEELIPMMFIHEKNGSWHPLSLQEGQFLIELPVLDTGQTIEKSPLNKDELLKEWSRWKKNAVTRFEKRNERLYVREQERIDRYWDSQPLQNQDKTEKALEEIKELKQKKSNTIDFDYLRELSVKIQKAEIRLQRLKLERVKLEEKCLEGKQKDYEELNKKLEITKREELLAVAKFKIT